MIFVCLPVALILLEELCLDTPATLLSSSPLTLILIRLSLALSEVVKKFSLVDAPSIFEFQAIAIPLRFNELAFIDHLTVLL